MCTFSFKFGDQNNSDHQLVGQLNSDFASEGIYETAANQFTYILISKRIGAQFFDSLDSVFISVDETRAYEAEF